MSNSAPAVVTTPPASGITEPAATTPATTSAPTDVKTELGTGTPAVTEPAKVETPPVLGPDGKPVAPAAKTADAAPITFAADKLTLPEGMKLEQFDKTALETLGATLADDKLDPQARGQKLFDLYTSEIKRVQESYQTEWSNTNKEWITRVKADPEIGGTKYEATKTAISKAIDTLGTDAAKAFREGLDATGAGNHPAIWKGLAKWAALLTEGGHVSGNPPSGKGPSTDAEVSKVFFPNSPDMKG